MTRIIYMNKKTNVKSKSPLDKTTISAKTNDSMVPLSDKQTGDIINYLTGQAPETGKAGPGFRIRTRTRISELFPKQNFFLSRLNQAPIFGSDAKITNIHKSFLYKAFRDPMGAITTGTKRLFSPLSRVWLKDPRLGGYTRRSNTNKKEPRRCSISLIEGVREILEWKGDGVKYI